MDGIKEKFKHYFHKQPPMNESNQGSENIMQSGILSMPESPEPQSNAASSSSPVSNAVVNAATSPDNQGWNIFGIMNRRSNNSGSPSSLQPRPESPLFGRPSLTARVVKASLPLIDVQTLKEDDFVQNRTGSGVKELGEAISPSTEGGELVNSEAEQAREYKFATDEPCVIRLVPYNPYFPTIDKQLVDNVPVVVGRFQRHNAHEDPGQEGIYYRSTVISRRHAVLLFRDGQIFIKDVKSLGGTFINSTRLSAAGKESKFFKLFHGDVIQFGVDYRPDARTGQVRNKDKCCEVLVELPKLGLKKKKKGPKPPKWDPKSHKHTECCICLSALYTKQTIFIAPCSHTFHYRCIAPLLRGKGFSCPLCRQESDLQDSLWSLDELSEDETNKNEDKDAQDKGRATAVPLTADSDNKRQSVVSSCNTEDMFVKSGTERTTTGSFDGNSNNPSDLGSPLEFNNGVGDDTFSRDRCSRDSLTNSVEQTSVKRESDSLLNLHPTVAQHIQVKTHESPLQNYKDSNLDTVIAPDNQEYASSNHE